MKILSITIFRKESQSNVLDDEGKCRKFHGKYEYQVSCFSNYMLNNDILNYIKYKASNESEDWDDPNWEDNAWYDIETSSDDKHDTFTILYESVPTKHIKSFIKTLE